MVNGEWRQCATHGGPISCDCMCVSVHWVECPVRDRLPHRRRWECTVMMLLIITSWPILRADVGQVPTSVP